MKTALLGKEYMLVLLLITASWQHRFKMADMMTVTLSSDHRAVDGAQAADWLQHLKSLLENPNTLLL